MVRVSAFLDLDRTHAGVERTTAASIWDGERKYMLRVTTHDDEPWLDKVIAEAFWLGRESVNGD